MKKDQIFSESLEKASPQLFGFAMKLTRNRADAQDLYQDAILRAFKNRDQYDDVDKFKPWLMTIMHNTFLTQYKKRKRRQELMSRANESFCLLCRSREDNRASTLMFYKEVSHLINDLGPVCAGPLKMYARGFSYEEIAEHYKIPIGTVKSRLNFARKKLQDKMAHLYDDIRLTPAA